MISRPPSPSNDRNYVAASIWAARRSTAPTFLPGLLLQLPFAGYRSDRVPSNLTDDNDHFLATVRSWLHCKMDAGELAALLARNEATNRLLLSALEDASRC